MPAVTEPQSPEGTKKEGVEVCVIGKDRLLRLIEECKCVYPYDQSLLDGDSYVLTVQQETTLQYLEHRNVTSHEIVFTPPDHVAHLTAKSRFGRVGLSFLNAAKVHSGFVGRLALEVVNLNNERQPITIKKGEPFMHIEFVSRLGSPSPYAGDYMFQYMTDEEVAMYQGILRERFPGVFEEELIERMASRRMRAP